MRLRSATARRYVLGRAGSRPLGCRRWPRPFPGARRPDRFRRVDAHGIGFSVVEWGDPDGRPVLLTHGGFDFAGTYDLFAPLLAAEGWRVVAWDQRGHGDSDRPELYSWEADVRDAFAVIDSIGGDPLPVIGHSKGGSLMLQVAEVAPHRITHVVNLDGLPSRRALARRRRAPAHQAPRRRAVRLARPPAQGGRQAAQARHHRAAGRAAQAHEPAPVDRVVALPRHRRRARGPRRLALEARSR